MAGYGSLHEVRNVWSIDDLATCADAMAIKADMETFAHEQAAAKAR
jgi:hypothetical protein